MTESYLDSLIKQLAKIPGFGPRSARRSALHLIKNKETVMRPLINFLEKCYSEIKVCEVCRNIDISSPCGICTGEVRDKNSLCIVEEVADLWAIERSKVHKGIYHVLGGNLSAVDGIGPEQLGLFKLEQRIKQNQITEVIIATNATIEGQTTAHYISDQLRPLGVKISRIAYGVPVGGELDYLDDGTLNAAFRSRQNF